MAGDPFGLLLRQRIVFLGGEVEDFGADALVGAAAAAAAAPMQHQQQQLHLRCLDQQQQAAVAVAADLAGAHLAQGHSCLPCNPL
jgi:hypothetical protein